MTYCQECGSEVAETDVFCPFCGISLQPVSIAGKSADSFESTIVMSLPANPKDAIPAEPAAETEPEAIPPEVDVAAEEVEAAPEEPLEKTSEETTPQLSDEPTCAEDEPTPAETAEPIGPEIEKAVEEPEHRESHSDLFKEVALFPDEEEASVGLVDAGTEMYSELKSEEPEVAAPDEPSADVETAAAEPDDIDAEKSEFAAVEAEPVVEEPETPADVTDEAVEPEDGIKLDEVDTMLYSDLEKAEPDAPQPDAAAESPVEAATEEVEALVVEEISVELTPPVSTEVIESPGTELPASDQPVSGKVGDTSSGEIAGDEKKSLTTPNFAGSSTDGRKSGLKPLSEGTLLNSRYQIVKKIGGGGMGAVYLAIDQNLGGTQRAVKEMVQSHIEEEQQAKAIEDFKRESMILSTLDHPSIPTIYDYFYDDSESRFYLVMKYIAGGDLAARLRATPEGRIDEKTVTEWAVQVIDVLHYLHSLPTTVVYRDLKPSNIMIDGNTGRIMLIDFGIARSINQTQEKGVTAVGTMGYAPPELFSGQVEPRSDIYSLGSTMFHLLTGADPQNNPLLIFDFQKNPRPRQINPRLSDQMERILMRSVEYNAEARFSSAMEMKMALQQHLDDLGTGRVTYGITEAPAAVSLANQNVFCGFCGQRIVATDMFCAFCGSKQPLAQHGVHSEIYAARSNATARLVIVGTTDLEAPAYALDKSENLVGRRDPMSNIFPEVDLSKYDPQTKISRRHARIWRDGNAFLVEDLGSSNGTVLLSKVSDTLRLAPHKPHPLANGDRIRVGDTTLQFIVG